VIELAGLVPNFGEQLDDGRFYCTGPDRDRCVSLGRERIGAARGGVPWLGRAAR
jgi:hypothetical protein